MDPLKLIKIIAMEDASLSFALPGFLRLLNACSRYCDEYVDIKNELMFQEFNASIDKIRL